MDFGVNQFNKDSYLYINPKLNMNFQNKWGFSLQAPLNFLAKDVDPKQQDVKLGTLRKFDYDSKSDYFKIINNIWYGTYGLYKPKEVNVSVFLGRMYDGHIGHGTIIGRYVNNPRPDVSKMGVMADINTDYGGIQVFANSVYTREVTAIRNYIRPFGIISGLIDLFSGKKDVVMLAANGNILDDSGRKKVREEIDDTKEEERYVEIETDPETGKKKAVEKTAPKKERKVIEDTKSPKFFDLRYFAIGHTYASDARAPQTLNLDTTGNIRYDKNNNPQVKRERRLGIEGYDMEFKIFSSQYFELTPYADYNRIRGIDNCFGRHYGVITKLGGRDINIILKPEYRSMRPNYIPIYFDSFYEVERYQINLDSNFPYTKHEYLTQKPVEGKDIKGYFHSVILNIYKIGFEANYEDYQGRNNSRVFVGAYLPIGQIFRISAFFIKKGFDRRQEAFKVDDKSQGAAELSINLGMITFQIQNRRRWILDQDTNQFKAKDEQMIFFTGGTSF